MKPQKLKRSATWWQIVKGSLLLSLTDKSTRKHCIKYFLLNARGIPLGSSPGMVLKEWLLCETQGYRCVKITAFWEVSK